MSIQIEKVILWRAGKSGETAQYDFAPGKLNIILGGHACGKTTFFKIIDYVLGGTTSHIDAHIEGILSWVGVMLLTPSAHHLFARAVPEAGRAKSSRCYHQEIPLQDNDYEVPLDLEPNANDEGIRKILAALVCGRPGTIAEGEKVTLPFSVPKSISFQGYATITNEAQLFDNLDVKTGKKWLPFVLGIERQDQINRKLELEDKKNKKSALTRELNIIKNVLEGWTKNLEVKLGQARAMSLYIPQPPDADIPSNLEGLLAEAKQLLDSTQDTIVLPVNDETAHEHSIATIRQLISEANELSYEIGKLQKKQKQLNDIAESLANFGNAAKATTDRLQIVRWLESKWRPNQGTFFTVCDAHTEQEAKDAFESIMKALKNYENTISNPDKRNHFDHQVNQQREELRQLIEKKKALLSQKNEQIRRCCAENKSADDALRHQQRAFDLIGEIKAIVQFANASGGRNVESQINVLATEISKLDEQFKEGERKEKTRRTSYLSSIAQRTHALLQGLHVSEQQKASSLEFDIDKIDLVLKSANATTRLSKESASSYHIAFHVALTCAITEHIVGRAEAAGLGFVIYDEPSRSEELGAANRRSNEVGHAVYQTLIQSVSHVRQGWQPIVIDTATKEDACKGLPASTCHVIEFKTGEGILPADWMQE